MIHDNFSLKGLLGNTRETCKTRCPEACRLSNPATSGYSSGWSPSVEHRLPCSPHAGPRARRRAGARSSRPPKKKNTNRNTTRTHRILRSHETADHSRLRFHGPWRQDGQFVAVLRRWCRNPLRRVELCKASEHSPKENTNFIMIDIAEDSTCESLVLPFSHVGDLASTNFQNQVGMFSLLMQEISNFKDDILLKFWRALSRLEVTVTKWRFDAC